MQISTQLPADPNVASRVNNRPPASTPSAPQTPAAPAVPDFDLNRLQSLEGDTGIPDETGAGQALGFLQSNILSQPGSALAAQANLNPDSVYALLA